MRHAPDADARPRKPGPRHIRPAIAITLALAALTAPHLVRMVQQARIPVLTDADDDCSPTTAETGGKVPNEWFFIQRAWPHADINQAARVEAGRQAAALELQSAAGAEAWQPEGPTNIGGRISDLAVHPTNPSICYAGGAEGGIFKTTDNGQTWTPLFDDQSSLSIGSLTIDPNAPETLYVGTGEANGGGGSVTYGGTGVFKSTDGGGSWENIGLEDSRHIGRIVVAPTEPTRLYVGVLGSLFSTGPGRGVYRSTDTGTSWELVLASTDSTGAVDVVVHPQNEDIVYAAMWERVRGPDYRRYGGPSSGLFRSLDGGDTWQELTSGLPTGPTVGRIGISISESDPDILYAIYADADPGFFVGVYKTTNGGDTWTQTNDGSLANVYASFGWWFGNIRVDPSNPDRAFVLGLFFARTTNGGSSWQEVGSSMHVDHHALEFAATNPSIMYEGNDGGMYRSSNGGSSWTKLPNLPVTQFYTVEIDDSVPERIYGGTQDNSTMRTLTGALDDWQVILGGDGFYCQVDPVDNSFIYAEYQNGNLFRSTNGGASFVEATTGLSGRRNWSMPVMLDPSDQTRLYCGTDRVFRSTNRAQSWSSISGDLTNGPGSGNSTFGTLTTVAVAEQDPDVIWAGSDDGNVWVTVNGGSGWTRVDATLPERWVTRVAVDPSDASVSYVTLSGFRWDEPLPHVFRSADFGATWENVSSNLPEAPVNDIVIDPADPSTLYVATDFGVFVSHDLGASWEALGAALPNVAVADLELHPMTRQLVAGTYGRSMWSIDLSATTAIVPEPDRAATVRAPRLWPAQPNPIPRSTGASLSFSLPRTMDVDLRIFSVHGRLVRRMITGALASGTHVIHWDGRGASGQRVAAGLYFVRLAADGEVSTRKVQVLAE